MDNMMCLFKQKQKRLTCDENGNNFCFKIMFIGIHLDNYIILFFSEIRKFVKLIFSNLTKNVKMKNYFFIKIQIII